MPKSRKMATKVQQVEENVSRRDKSDLHTNGSEQIRPLKEKVVDPKRQEVNKEVQVTKLREVK